MCISFQMANSWNVRECFRYDARSKSAICLVKQSGVSCQQKISNNHHGNKIRHLKTAHPNIYDRIRKIKKKTKLRNASGRITVQLSIENVYAAFVELVSKNGRPIRICKDSGMRKLLDPILEAINVSTGQQFTINDLIIKEKVNQAYEFVQNKIINEIESKSISLMIDITTKHNRSVLGINIRYLIDGQIVSRTIGMEPLTKNHTAEYIHKVLRSILVKYGIKPNQIIALATDNAGNVVNVTDYLNDDCENYLMEEGCDMEDQIVEQINFNVHGYLLDSIKSFLESDYPFVDTVACGAHTVQLAIKDTLALPQFEKQIEIVRKIVKQLRTPTIANILSLRNLKQAIIDHEIRWNYTYLMVIIFFLSYLS